MATDRDAQYDNSAKRLIEGLPYMQIADMLRISLPTVNYHVGFAMAALKNKLKHG